MAKPRVLKKEIHAFIREYLPQSYPLQAAYQFVDAAGRVTVQLRKIRGNSYGLEVGRSPIGLSLYAIFERYYRENPESNRYERVVDTQTIFTELEHLFNDYLRRQQEDD